MNSHSSSAESPAELLEALLKAIVLFCSNYQMTDNVVIDMKLRCCFCLQENAPDQSTLQLCLLKELPGLSDQRPQPTTLKELIAQKIAKMAPLIRQGREQVYTDIMFG